MNNHKHQNNSTNNNNSTSLAAATDEKVEQCINDTILELERRGLEEEKKEHLGEFTIRNLLYSIHRKEWKQVVSHFLGLYYFYLYDNIYDDYYHTIVTISSALRHMSKHNLQFPLGKEDNFEEFINLFIGTDDDDTSDDKENENTDCQEAKYILLLLIATHQRNTCVDVINILVHRKGNEFIINSQKVIMDRNVLSLCLDSDNQSIGVVNRLIEVGGRELVMEKNGCYKYTALYYACRSSNPSIDVIKKLINVGGRELLMVQVKNGKRCHPFLLSCNMEEAAIKTLVEEGLRLSLGGEFGIGGLFNCCTTTDENGNSTHDHPRQIKMYEQIWTSPALRNEELKLLLNDHPILHAAIIAEAPSNIIQDIIYDLPQSVTFQDSKGRYAIDVAVKEGLKWDDGLKQIVEKLVNQQGQTVMNVASYYGVKWNDGMEEVVEANEEHIGTADDLTSLYPFMLAAVGNAPRNYDLNTVYNLIERRPDVVKLYSISIQIGRRKRKLEETNTI